MDKIKKQKVENYEAGYGKTALGTVKKTVAVTAAAAAMVGGLTGCFRNSVMGDMEYQYDGDMQVESVSGSDVPQDACSSDDGMFALDGDVAYVSSEQS